MKVAFVCYEAFSHGGIRTYARELLPRIASLGHDITLFAPTPNRLDRNSEPTQVPLAVVNSVDLVFMRAPSFWWNLPRRIKEVERQTGKFDLVHSNNVADLFLRTDSVSSPRIVTAFHLGLSTLREGRMSFLSGLAHPSSEYGAAIIAQAICLRRASRIVTISEFTSREILRYHPTIRPENVRVIYPGVSRKVPTQEAEALEAVRNRFRLIKREPIILFTGRLETRKGLAMLLESFATLLKQVKAQLVIVGAGRQAPWLRRAAKLGVSNRVTFAGYVDEATYLALCGLARVYVQPSIVEGFGLAAAEAASMGLPVVATRSGAMPEVLQNGVDGILVDFGNLASLVDAIASILGNERKSAHSTPADRFTWERTAFETVELYREVLNNA